MAIKNNFKNFDEYLDQIGADKIQITSSWELARFRANNEICIVYHNKKGSINFSSSLADKVYSAFRDGRLINIQSEKRKSLGDKFKFKIYERDGNKCFYSGKEMVTEEATIEHLIPLSKGGESNHVVLLTDVSYNTWKGIKTDDEHRVWYVAVSRAKKNLTIVREQSNKFYKI